MSKPLTQVLYEGTVKIHRDGKHRYSLLEVRGEPLPEKTILPSATGVTGLHDKSGALVNWALNEGEAFLKDRWLPGVPYTETEILSLLRKMKSARFEKKDTAADVGSLVHDWLEAYLASGEEPPRPMDEQANRGIDAALLWLDQEQIEVEHVERVLYSPEHDYVGTTDLIGRTPNWPVVLDWKTGSGVYKEAHWQAAAYALAAMEEGLVDSTVHRVIVHLDKETGVPEPYDLELLAERRARFGYKNSMVHQTLGSDMKAFLGLREVYRNVKEL